MYKWIVIPEGVLLSKVSFHERKNLISLYKTDKNVIIPYDYLKDNIDDAVKKWKELYGN